MSEFEDKLNLLVCREAPAARHDPERMGCMIATLVDALALACAIGAQGKPDHISELLEGVSANLFEAAAEKAPLAKIIGSGVCAMTWPFGTLRPLSYDVILCDPPWRFRTWGEHNQSKSASRHYALMELADIQALPIRDLAQRDCILLLWVTAPMLKQGFDTMAAWGFTYKSNIAWRKLYPSGKVRMGTGYWARSMHETVLIGSIGKPGKFSAFPSLFDGIAREHSRKPEEFYALVDKHTNGMRRADLFSRESRPGFDAYGFETGKFDPPLLMAAE